MQRRPGRGRLGAREGAEAVERRDAEEIPQAPLGRGRIEPVAGDGRHGGARLAPEVLQLGIVEDLVRHDDLARLEPGDLGREPGGVGLR